MNIINYHNLTWIDIENPKEEDVSYLEKNFKFHPATLKELIPPSLRTKVENYNDYLYLVFHFPFYHRQKRMTYSREIDLLITKEAIITVHPKSILPLKALFDKCNLYEESRSKFMSEGSGMITFYIIDELLNSCFPKLKNISQDIDNVELGIFSGEEKKMINEIAIVKHNILDFRRVIKPKGAILNSLIRMGVGFWGKDIQPYFEELYGDYLRVWDFLENNRESIEALEDTNNSLFSAKLNETMKILTIYTVVLLPTTVLMNFFGMSIHYPFSDSPWMFWILLGLNAIIITFMIFYFRMRKWL